MRLDLEVLDLAEDVLRQMAEVYKLSLTWSEHLTDLADRISDVVMIEEDDGV
jgi:hypothetical protein